MTEVVDRSLQRERFVAQLGSFFGLFALLLAAMGLYGVMSYAISQRTREIGIRLALGAQRAQISWLVLRETMLLVAVGGVIGLGGAIVFTRFVASLLFGLQPTDPVTITCAALVMLTVASLAVWLPARRATRIEPMAALREE
jgi:ABC-type antimicrobial peptide transport system permease subunit